MQELGSFSHRLLYNQLLFATGGAAPLLAVRKNICLDIIFRPRDYIHLFYIVYITVMSS